MDEFIDREVTSDGGKETLDGCLVAVDVQQAAHDLGCSNGVDTLHIYFNELREPILIQVEDKVVNKVETIANNDKGKLVAELGLLEEILDLLGVVIVALATDTLDLPDLTSSGSGLNVLEVNLRISAEIDDGTEVIV